jgi:hypothetical protein
LFVHPSLAREPLGYGLYKPTPRPGGLFDTSGWRIVSANP